MPKKSDRRIIQKRTGRIRACFRRIWLLMPAAVLMAVLAGCGGRGRAWETIAAAAENTAETVSEGADGEGTVPAEEAEGQKEPAGRILGAEKAHLTEGQQQVILDYMDLYYESLARLAMPETSRLRALFSESGEGYAAFHRQTWEYLIGLRKQQNGDLRLDRYEYELEVYETEQQENGDLHVAFAEKSVLYFAQCPDIPSESPRLRHDFLLHEEKGEWKLAEHMQWDGVFWNMVKERKDQEISEIPEEYFRERKEQLLEQDRQGRELREEPAGAEQGQEVGLQPGAAEAEQGQEAGSELKPAGEEQGQEAGSEPESAEADHVRNGGAADHAYDRGAAVAYANAWVGYRNPQWPDFSGSGGNCQNFVSQCLYAGGIPMDTEGTQVWKWYGEELNQNNTEAGGSLSWINVDSFYEYARDNQGFGLAALADAGYWEGQEGDLIRMGVPEDWNHVVIITHVVKDAKGRTIDYLITSNTSELKNFPASTYPLPRKALIRILGWREGASPGPQETE